MVSWAVLAMGEEVHPFILAHYVANPSMHYCGTPLGIGTTTIAHSNDDAGAAKCQHVTAGFQCQISFSGFVRYRQWMAGCAFGWLAGWLHTALLRGRQAGSCVRPRGRALIATPVRSSLVGPMLPCKAEVAGLPNPMCCVCDLTHGMHGLCPPQGCVAVMCVLVCCRKAAQQVVTESRWRLDKQLGQPVLLITLPRCSALDM